MKDEKTSVVIMALHEKNVWFFFAHYSLTAHFFSTIILCWVSSWLYTMEEVEDFQQYFFLLLLLVHATRIFLIMFLNEKSSGTSLEMASLTPLSNGSLMPWYEKVLSWFFHSVCFLLYDFLCSWFVCKSASIYVSFSLSLNKKRILPNFRRSMPPLS